MNIFLAPVLFAGVFAAYVMDDSDIDNGNVEMYSQVTHTGNVVFIGNRNGIFYPCRCRQIKGEPPYCPVAYPSLGSLGFAGRRHSSDVVELKRGKGFWCKFSSLKMPEGHKQGSSRELGVLGFFSVQYVHTRRGERLLPCA